MGSRTPAVMIDREWLECLLTSYYLFVQQFQGDPDIQVLSFLLKSSRKVSRIPKCEIENFITEIDQDKQKDDAERRRLKLMWSESCQSKAQYELVVESRVAQSDVTHNLLIITNTSVTALPSSQSLKLSWRECKMYSSLLVELRSLASVQVSPPCLRARYVPGCESLLALDDMRYQGYNETASLSSAALSSYT